MGGGCHQHRTGRRRSAPHPRASWAPVHHVNVDQANGVIQIRRTDVWVNRRGVKKATKTHRMRRISLDAATIDALTAHRKARPHHRRGAAECPRRRIPQKEKAQRDARLGRVRQLRTAHQADIHRQDRQSMQFAFRLWFHGDVSANADAIRDRLQIGVMPCDGAWLQPNISPVPTLGRCRQTELTWPDRAMVLPVQRLPVVVRNGHDGTTLATIDEQAGAAETG